MYSGTVEGHKKSHNVRMLISAVEILFLISIVDPTLVLDRTSVRENP